MSTVSLPDPEFWDWRQNALCAETDPEAFFVEKDGPTRTYDAAKKVCDACPARVRKACLDDVMADERGLMRSWRAGMRGGLTPTQREKADPTVGVVRVNRRKEKALRLAALGLDRVTIANRTHLHPDTVSRYMSEAS